MGMDVSGRVQTALAGVSIGNSDTGLAAKSGLLRPLASFAVAASVAAVVVVGGMQLNEMQSATGEPPVVAVSPPGMMGSMGGTAVRASYGAQQQPLVLQPAAPTGYRELARQRMHRYMQTHAEAAALNTPQGLIPFARVTEIKE